MYRHLRPVFPHHHDESRIGHDQGVGTEFDNGLDIAQEGLHLGVVRQHVGGEEELLAGGMHLLDAILQLREGIEIVVAHTQRVARHTGVDRIGAVGDGVAQVLKGAGGSQQFGGFHHNFSGISGS